MDPYALQRRLTCILAADAVGYSKHMGQDEEGTIQVLAAHRAVIDGIIAFHRGRIVGTAGDSVLAEFTSAVEAVRCAVEIQDALRTRNDALPEHRRLQFRVGVNLGDVVVKDADLLGDGVNVAARLESLAEPGGICIASSVYDQITGKLDLGFQDIGEQSLKNITRPVRGVPCVWRAGRRSAGHACRRASACRRQQAAAVGWCGGCGGCAGGFGGDVVAGVDSHLRAASGQCERSCACPPRLWPAHRRLLHPWRPSWRPARRQQRLLPARRWRPQLRRALWRCRRLGLLLPRLFRRRPHALCQPRRRWWPGQQCPRPGSRRRRKRPTPQHLRQRALRSRSANLGHPPARCSASRSTEAGLHACPVHGMKMVRWATRWTWWPRCATAICVPSWAPPVSQAGCCCAARSSPTAARSCTHRARPPIRSTRSEGCAAAPRSSTTWTPRSRATRDTDSGGRGASAGWIFSACNNKPWGYRA
jgi:class 3 adenylate cyclase